MGGSQVECPKRLTIEWRGGEEKKGCRTGRKSQCLIVSKEISREKKREENTIEKEEKRKYYG